MSENIFSDEQIAKAISELSSYNKYKDIATLTAGDYNPEVIEAFAKLARALKSAIRSEYGNLKVVQELPYADQLKSALATLKYQAERGELIPAGTGYAEKESK